MTHHSTTQLLVLHAARLEGFGDFEVIAKRAGTSRNEAIEVLAEAERVGWVQNAAFADLEGWSLTDSGKVENERQLAAERRWADTADVVTAVYREFLPLNARLLRAVTDWQIAPTDTDRFAPNRHTDPEWDARVLAELTALSRELAPLTARLAAVLSRFGDYTPRVDSALAKAREGQTAWIDSSGWVSCLRVWFQLHEDLLATLGIDRRQEP